MAPVRTVLVRYSVAATAARGGCYLTPPEIGTRGPRSWRLCGCAMGLAHAASIARVF